MSKIHNEGPEEIIMMDQKKQKHDAINSLSLALEPETYCSKKSVIRHNKNAQKTYQLKDIYHYL